MTVVASSYLPSRRSTANFNSKSNVGAWTTIAVPRQDSFYNLYPSQQFLAAYASLAQEVQKHPERMAGFNIEDFASSFFKVVQVLLLLNTSVIYTQVTALNSLVIKAETASGNIYTELFFDEATGWLNEAVVNIFHQQTLQFNSSGSLASMVLAIKQYFGIEEIDYSTYLNQATAYELSGGTFTPAHF